MLGQVIHVCVIDSVEVGEGLLCTRPKYNFLDISCKKKKQKKTYDVYMEDLLPKMYERMCNRSMSGERHRSCDNQVLFPVHSLCAENCIFGPCTLFWNAEKSNKIRVPMLLDGGAKTKGQIKC